MAIEPDREPLARAIDVARRTDPTWPDVREGVLRRVREILPPGEPVTVLADGGDADQDPAGSRTTVSTRVVAAALRRALSVSPSHAPVAVRLVADAGRLDRVDLDLVVAYGLPLDEVAERVHADARAELARLLGAGAVEPGAITVTVVDVVDGDPTRT